MSKSTGEKINDLRNQKSLTQEQLAENLDVNSITIQNWEKNKTTPIKQNVKKLCNYFNVDSDYLLGITEARRKKKIVISCIGILIITILVYLVIPKSYDYRIVNINSEYEVEGRIIFDYKDKKIIIDSVELKDKEKYQDIKLYDYGYVLKAGNEEIIRTNSMCGGYDNQSSPTYFLIEKFQTLKIETEITKEQFNKAKNNLELIIYYDDENFELNSIIIKLKLTN